MAVAHSPDPGQPDPALHPDLMRTLGRLVRGLSALFWGLPVALVVCVQTCRTSILAGLGIVPPIVANALLLYALVQMGSFHKQERVWQRALERSKLLAVLNIGLSPFLYWWKMMPQVLHYQFAVLVLALSGLLLLFTLNQVLQRLAAMLPDETLRLEAKLFTQLDLYLLLGTLLLGATWVGVNQFDHLESLPSALLPLLDIASRIGVLLLLLLTLLPLALTMALIWKIKETILASVFSPD